MSIGIFRVLTLTAALVAMCALATEAGQRGGPNHGAIVSAQARGAHGGDPSTHGNSGPHGKSGGPHGRSGEHAVNATSNTSIADRINGKPNLKARLEGMLNGLSIKDASDGFRNQGQFIAAVEASNHFNIPFADLKHEMTTGDHPLSLGQAIKKLRPNQANASGDENNAQEEPKKPARSNRDHTDRDDDVDD
jgi:hypothetical protein